MDLGCIDMGCVEKQRKQTNLEKENSPKESVMSASKLGKNNRAKDAVRSSLNALNKLTSQITKPPRRKTSPLNWFPRKKVEPYLKRKIKMLQEVDGMHLTLDETLGDSNPHYSKVLREKMAIREAAQKSMDARKAAMVEASWCRILQAARIESKEAVAQLLKAEAAAAEAFEAARAIGVIMNDTPESAENSYRIETTSAKGGGGSTTHTISATFETAFEVDKQVAAAVKAAFVQLAHCPSIDKDEFKELLRKISENPDSDENLDEVSGFNSESETGGSELEVGPLKDSSNGQDSRFSNKEIAGARQRKQKKGQNLDIFSRSNIVEMMFERLRCLKEDELASLATIVATCGLSAALAESQINMKSDVSSALENAENPHLKDQSRTSIGGRSARNSFTDTHARRTTTDAELPSLDKFLVKRLTKLEKEVLEARNARKTEAKDGTESKLDVPEGEETFSCNNTRSMTKKLKENDAVPDLGNMLLKHSSKLEKEVEEARRINGKSSDANTKKFQVARPMAKQEAVEVPSLDKFLVKRLSKLEREIQEARNRNSFEPIDEGRVIDSEKSATFLADASNLEQVSFSSDADSLDKENVDMNKIEQGSSNTSLSPVKIVTEQDHLLQRNRKEEPSSRVGVGVQKHLSKQGGNKEESYESLDKVLVKHVSKLEREKLKFSSAEQWGLKPKHKGINTETESSEGSLDQVLAKPKSRLEREKIAAVEKPDESIRHSVSRRQARERELQEAWGGLSLGNSIRPHVSRLQRDKAAWIKAEEEERKREVGEV